MSHNSAGFHWIFHFQIPYYNWKPLAKVLNSTCRNISGYELLQIVNFHGFKIESNAWGIWRILYYETNREALSVLCCVENHSEVLRLIWYP